jgi:hypothetical protein
MMKRKKQMEEAKQGVDHKLLVGTDGKVKSPEFLKGVKPKTSYNTGASKELTPSIFIINNHTWLTNENINNARRQNEIL